MFYKRPRGDYFELVAVTRVYVLEKNRVGDLELRVELADGTTLERVTTRGDYTDFLATPPAIII